MGVWTWVISPEYDAQQLTQPVEVQHAGNTVLGRIAIAEATPCETLELEVKRHFMRLLGEAMVCVFEDDFTPRTAPRFRFAVKA